MCILILFRSNVSPFVGAHKHLFPAEQHIVLAAQWLTGDVFRAQKCTIPGDPNDVRKKVS